MLNNKYFYLTENLITEYKKVFLNMNNDEIFEFLRKYLKYIESDDECYNRYFILSDPMKTYKKNKEIVDEFNSRIGSYLETMLTNIKEKIEKKSIEGNVTCYLGVAYEYGLFGKPKDYSIAFYYYTISAQLHNSLGTFRLGICYEKGIGTLINYEKAVYFYRCAAKLRLVDGMHVYGTILVNGYLNSVKNVNIGRHFLTSAGFCADKIYPFALFDIGKLYENKKDEKDVLKDLEYARNIYTLGVTLGDPNCMFRLAESYEFGDLLNKCDLKKAFEYYKIAAKSGHVNAQMWMSEFYFHGNQNKNYFNPKKSYMWALCAATKGNGRSAYIIGEYTMNGCGVEKNKLLSLWWYIISTYLGNTDANIKIEELRYQVEREDEGVFHEQSCCKFFC